MRSTGPGGIKTMKQRSAPEMLAVLRRTKYQCVPPTWRERTPPSDRKWPRYGRNWAAVATSLANTRTASLTSDEGVEQIQEEEEIKAGLNWRLWIFLGWHDGQNGVKKNGDDDEEADDYDDECIRQGEGLCNEAQVSRFVEVSALKWWKTERII